METEVFNSDIKGDSIRYERHSQHNGQLDSSEVPLTYRRQTITHASEMYRKKFITSQQKGEQRLRWEDSSPSAPGYMAVLKLRSRSYSV
ncbi:hypothetical protein EB796_009104 [Bugula neritina]|uniref:Uncharacterized protein n=1 Tax=Bugula neritina TaxID=10212 RepID=A0A7J7K2T3_BUGNE|nr:hypothetical protein EB796_009104 [Bugula neritina]